MTIGGASGHDKDQQLSHRAAAHHRRRGGGRRTSHSTKAARRALHKKTRRDTNDRIVCGRSGAQTHADSGVACRGDCMRERAFGSHDSRPSRTMRPRPTHRNKAGTNREMARRRPTGLTSTHFRAASRQNQHGDWSGGSEHGRPKSRTSKRSHNRRFLPSREFLLLIGDGVLRRV